MTREEKEQATAAIYGVPERSSMSNTPLTNDEAERLRQILNAHDQQTAPREFDLNKPPVEPYKHQEFPRLVYHHGERIYVVVRSREELEDAERNGFQKDPYPSEAPEVELSAADAAEAARIDAQLAKLKRSSRKDA